jgi:hypothetical protein
MVDCEQSGAPLSGQRPTATSPKDRAAAGQGRWHPYDRKRLLRRVPSHFEHLVPDAVRIAAIRHRFRKPPAYTSQQQQPGIGGSED